MNACSEQYTAHSVHRGTGCSGSGQFQRFWRERREGEAESPVAGERRCPWAEGGAFPVGKGLGPAYKLRQD